MFVFGAGPGFMPPDWKETNVADDTKLVIDAINQAGSVVVKQLKGPASSIAPFITAGAAVFVAIFSYWTSTKASELTRQLQEVKRNVDIQHTRISDRQSEAAMGESLYREVFVVLADSNEKKKGSMLALLGAIEAGYRDDEDKQSMRGYIKQLEGLFGDSADPTLKATASFYIEDAAIPYRAPADEAKNIPSQTIPQEQQQVVTYDASGTKVSPGSAGGWDYDVFWCEGNQPLAQTIFEGLRELQVSQSLGRIRLRQVPNSIRQSANFDIANQVVIRRHVSKDVKAQQFQSDLKQILKAKGKNISINIEDSPQRLPWYLSVFVCLG